MNRDRMLDEAQSGDLWDVIVIGGGASGLGAAVDAVSRGYRTLLVEQSDFSKGTSSRSTKLVHGGVRYLRQGNVALVMEALRERGRMMRNAPHLVHERAFVLPTYDWWEGPFYGIGLKMYDLLAGRAGIAPSRSLSRDETLAAIPTLEPDGLRGGVRYLDAQFDDARMAISLARTAADLGACVLNYVRVVGFAHEQGMVRGVEVVDVESGRAHVFRARAIINATGIFSDQVRRLDDPDAPAVLTTSQGIHLVLDSRFLPGENAILVPSTSDGRVLFAVPWMDRVVLGTTDTPTGSIELEPRALREEVEYLLIYAAKYLTGDPMPRDVLSVFAGLRPLVATGETDSASISRDHTTVVAPSGLISMNGGKWTTYRAMAEDAIDAAAEVGDLSPRQSRTAELLIHGAGRDLDDDLFLQGFGFDAAAIRELASVDANLAAPIHERLPIPKAVVAWTARHEMARTVEDVLSRRVRALILDARAASEAADDVARILAYELERDQDWADEQVREFRKTCEEYLLPGGIGDA